MKLLFQNEKLLKWLWKSEFFGGGNEFLTHPNVHAWNVFYTNTSQAHLRTWCVRMTNMRKKSEFYTFFLLTHGAFCIHFEQIQIFLFWKNAFILGQAHSKLRSSKKMKSVKVKMIVWQKLMLWNVIIKWIMGVDTADHFMYVILNLLMSMQTCTFVSV